MSRRLEMVCAAALLFAATGCSTGGLLTDRLLVSWGGSEKQLIVNRSVYDVAARLQTSLSKKNIIVAVSPMDKDTIKLNGQTQFGKRFALVLKRQTAGRGENTSITIEWEEGADNEFWATVVELLVKPETTITGASSPAAGATFGRCIP